MKILYIITQGELGGAQRYVRDLARKFSDQNEIIMANSAQGDQWLKKQCEMTDIKTHQFKYLVREINLVKDIIAFFEIKKYIQEIKPDFIHVNSTKAGVLVAFAKGQAPSVYTVHGWVFNEPMNWLQKQLYILIEKMSCRWHNKIIVLGKNDLRLASRLHLGDDKKNSVIPHGEYHINSIVTKTELGLNPKIINLVTIANFYKTKGLEYLIKAMNDLDDVELTIFGDGPERETIEPLIADKQKIKLAGRDNDAPIKLPAFDIFVLPSLKEGFPYVILEAMNAEVPIVTTNVGEIPNILENEKTALLVEPADSAALANAIKRLADDSALRATLATNAKKRLADFSFKQMMEKYEQLYKTLAPRNK